MKQSPAKTRPQVPFGKLRASSRQAFGPLRSGLVRSLVGNTRGAEIAETAMIMPLLFMMVMGIFWMGQAFRIYGTLGHAARAGVRAAVAPVCTTCAAAGTGQAQIAQAAVQNALTAANVSVAYLVSNTQWTPPILCQCRTGGGACTAAASVPCSGGASVSNVCVQENVQLSNPSDPNSAGGMGTCGISVSMRYQYPYSFKIPFTAIDLGNIKLPGQAQMRAETQ